MSLTRIHNLSISLDGFATGQPQSLEAPFGHAGEGLHTWMLATLWLTAYGETLLPVVEAVRAWGEAHLQRSSGVPRSDGMACSARIA